MADTLLAALVWFVYVLTVALSPVLAVGVVLVSRRRSVTAALGTVVGVVAAVVTLGATVGLAVLSWQAGLVLFLAGQGALFGLCLVPVLLGRGLVRARTGLDREPALRVAVSAWPVALAASYGFFVGAASTVPLGHAGLRWGGWALIVLLGPGVLGTAGVAVHRWIK